MVFILSQKCNYHVDEIWNYGLSNQKGFFCYIISDGIIYKPGEAPFMDFLTVDPEHRFDYPNVWRNQSSDVHPPFYYVLVHTICSFFPKQFSPWYAGIVNIIFALLTLLVLRKISRFFLDNPFLVNVVSLAFILSAGIQSSITFLRMYVTAMFWVTLLTYCFIKRINNEYRTEKGFLVMIFVVTLLGSLTHYYCLVYAALISAVYVLFLVAGKKIREARNFCFTILYVGVVSNLLFPAMLNHIFYSGRSKEALNNAINIFDFYTRINGSFAFVNQQLFGNFGLILFLVIAVLFVFAFKYSEKSELCMVNYYGNKWTVSYLFLCFPALLYFIIISKITVFIDDRYIFPIYAITFWSIVLLLINLLSLTFISNKANILTIVVLSIITIGSWTNCKWTYLFLDSKEFLQKVDAYAPIDCISIYSYDWELLPMFNEAKKYKSIRFIRATNEKMLEKVVKETEDNCKNIDTGSKIILSLVGIPSSEHNKYINMFLRNKNSYNSFQKIGSYSYGTSYILYEVNG